MTESELHDRLYSFPTPHGDVLIFDADQGTTERLADFWLPLDKFTEECMEKLLHGDVQIPVGDAVTKWERFERGKMELMERVPH